MIRTVSGRGLSNSRLLLLLPLAAYGVAVTILVQQNPVYWVLSEAANPGSSAVVRVVPDWSTTLQQATRASLPAFWLAPPVVVWLGRSWCTTNCKQLGEQASQIITSVKEWLNPPFRPQYSAKYAAGPVPVYEHFDLAKKQLLRIRFAMDEAMIDECVVVVIRGSPSSSDQHWTAGRVVKDCPKVGHGEVIRFRSPSSGRYVLAITSRREHPVRLTVEFDKMQ